MRYCSLSGGTHPSCRALYQFTVAVQLMNSRSTFKLSFWREKVKSTVPGHSSIAFSAQEVLLSLLLSSMRPSPDHAPAVSSTFILPLSNVVAVWCSLGLPRGAPFGTCFVCGKSGHYPACWPSLTKGSFTLCMAWWTRLFIRCSLFWFLFLELISYVISNNQFNSYFHATSYNVFFACCRLLCKLTFSGFSVCCWLYWCFYSALRSEKTQNMPSFWLYSL